MTDDWRHGYSEKEMRQAVADEVRAMVHDYPPDVWPELRPDERANDAQAADVIRRMLPRIASRIERNGTDDQ